MFRRLMLSTSATLLMITAFGTSGSAQLSIHYYGVTESLPSVDESWTRSAKQDDIETFYRYEKTGSDTFQVEVKIVNNRPKSVKVRVQVQYDSGGPSRRYLVTDHTHKFLTQPSRRLNDTCEIVVPSRSSRICQDIEVTAKKITGVRIFRWDNVNED